MSEVGFVDKLRGRRKDNGAQQQILQPEPEPRLAERFAHDVQMVEALEQALHEARKRAQDQENRALIAEDQLAKTEEKLAQMEVKRDYFMQRFIETNSKLRSAATTVYDCIRESKKDMDEIDKEKGVDPYKPKPEAERAIARAIANREEGEHPPVPKSVIKPAETEEPRR